VVSEVIRLLTATRAPGADRAARGVPPIRTDAVYVVYTSIEDTLAAVRVANRLAVAMAAPLTLVHFRTLSYLMPVDAPAGVSPVETDAFVARLREEGIDVRVRVYMCREERRTIPIVFKPRSLVVIAGRRQWGTGPAARWRRRLQSAGHFVVFVDVSSPEDSRA
jgi:hypothetical protein